MKPLTLINKVGELFQEGEITLRIFESSPGKMTVVMEVNDNTVGIRELNGWAITCHNKGYGNLVPMTWNEVLRENT